MDFRLLYSKHIYSVVRKHVFTALNKKNVWVALEFSPRTTFHQLLIDLHLNMNFAFQISYSSTTQNSKYQVITLSYT